MPKLFPSANREIKSILVIPSALFSGEHVVGGPYLDSTRGDTPQTNPQFPHPAPFSGSARMIIQEITFDTERNVYVIRNQYGGRIEIPKENIGKVTYS